MNKENILHITFGFALAFAALAVWVTGDARADNVTAFFTGFLALLSFMAFFQLINNEGDEECD